MCAGEGEGGLLPPAEEGVCGGGRGACILILAKKCVGEVGMCHASCVHSYSG